jgi:general secretion pathway protein L
MTSALDAGGSTAKIGSGFASLSGALRAFLDWERREAEKLLPRALRSWALGRGARAAVIAGGGAELVVADAPGSPGFRISGAEILAGSLDGALARRKFARKGLVLALELPAKSFLTRRFDLPAAALSRLDAVVTAEIERKTPFRRDDLFVQTSVQPHAAPGKTTVALTLLRRDLAVGALEGSGLFIDDISIISAAPGDAPMRIALGKAKNDRRFFRVAGVLAALAAALMLAGLGADFWRQSQQAAELDARIADLTEQAGKIRRSADRAGKEARLLQRLHEARRRDAPMTVLWEEISHLTPDSAYLSELRLAQDKDGERSAELVGLARSAVDLPLLYGRSRYVSEATLTAPITVDAREKMESFSMRLKIRKTPAQETPAQETPAPEASAPESPSR